MSNRLWFSCGVSRAIAFAAVALALTAPEAAAQRKKATIPAIETGDGTPNVTPASARPGFRLFANADLAGTGMKNVQSFGTGISNIGGPCADGFVLFQCNNVFKNGGWQFTTFEQTLLAGVPPSQRARIAAVYPGVSSATGAGFSSVMNFPLLGLAGAWGPADNTLGVLFSGATSTDDGTCRDNTNGINGFMTTGISLLAGSTCPDTWSSGRFDGPRPIPEDAYYTHFTADPNNYRFDYWKIPKAEHDQTRQLGDFSTYGRTTDHYDDILRSFGSITKLGSDRGYSNAPSVAGYPLGLDVYFEAFTFALPAIANAVFWQMTVVNNSAKVYGTGVDYDSLYMGLETGTGGAPQNVSNYYVPSQNALKHTNNGVNTGCNAAITGGGIQGCSNVGFRNFGAIGVITLKSPIGDERNKLFSDPSSRFYNPSNIHVGDTITVNHGHMCGFGGCTANTHLFSERSSFGMISSTETNVLDGRTAGGYAGGSASAFWRTFRNRDFPTRTPRFTRYVPGNWDYNRDGIQDTLFLDSCDVSGCVRTYADTMPGKQVNGYGNVGGVLTAGPFSLRAGDTTSFVWAFVGAPDSSGFELLVRSVISTYKSFYLTPTPPPVPRITSVSVREGETGQPQVGLFYTNDPEVYVDPFLTKVANDLTGSTLDVLNPGLVDSIRARARNNFTELLIFKSCDGGNTFTSDADCVGDPAEDPQGNPIGAGWQAYAVIPAVNGQIPNSFFDNNVIGGRTFLYSLVTRSRGFSAPVRDIDPATGAVITRTYVAVEPLESALKRDGPSVAKVYVPISRPAGTTLASFTRTDVTGRATVPLTIAFNQDVVGGTYELVFGNRFVIRTQRNASSNAILNTTVTVEEVIASTVRNGVNASNTVVRQQVFDAGAREVAVGATITGTGTTTSGGVRTTTDTVAALGYVLVQCASATNCAAGTPIFVSTSLTTSGSTPDAAFGLPNFPNFRVQIDQARAGQLVLERLIKDNGDTVFVNIMNNNSIQYRQESSTATANAGGNFEFRFGDDVFGPQSPFRIDYADPTRTQSAVTSSLNARAVVTTGDTTANVRTTLAAFDATTFGGATFVPVKFPFSLYDVTGPTPQPLILAMVERSRYSRPNSIRLGNANDTLRVQVPADVWVPGDRFAALRVIQRDSIVGGRTVLDVGSGTPIQVSDTVVAFAPLVLGCNNPIETCNPLAVQTPGATGYLPTAAGWKLAVDYGLGFSSRNVVQLAITPSSVRPVAQLTRSDTRTIRAVPNPFVFQSFFDEVGNQRVGEPRIVFTGVPQTGDMYIYSVSGQFLQQLTWDASTLNGNGDLFYNLRTREGTELTSGLFIYVIRSAGKVVHRGKFVVIR